MKPITPLKSIRKKCLDCMGYQSNEVKSCPLTQCSLWKFRLGIHPFTEKNRENPFLEPKNFEGMENMTSYNIIKKVSKML